MSRLEKIKTRMKTYHYGIWFMSIFFISLGILVRVTRWMIPGTFWVGVDIPYSEDTEFFEIRTGYGFLQPLALGPIFGIIYYILMKMFLGKVDKKQGNNKYYVFAIEIVVVALIIFNCIGHVFHLGLEYVNALDKTNGAALDSDYKEMFVYAWYLDELLGHSMVHVTYFGYLVMAVITELLIKQEDKMILDEYILVFLFAYFLSLLNGEIANKSQSGLVMLILQIIFVLIFGFFVIIKKIDLRKYPILLAMILSTIPIIYFNVARIITHGLLDYYPFW